MREDAFRLANLANSPETTSATLARLGHYEIPLVRKFVAKNGNVSTLTLIGLVSDSDVEVRKIVRVRLIKQGEGDFVSKIITLGEEQRLSRTQRIKWKRLSSAYAIFRLIVGLA